jgi:hypothetical protein
MALHAFLLKCVQTADTPIHSTSQGAKGWPQPTDAAPLAEWNLLSLLNKRQEVRVVTIKHPPDVIDGLPPDNSVIGQIHDLPPQLAMLMIAAGWMRSDTRSQIRRSQDLPPFFNRRRTGDRRSES